jgi:hypothetical protein
MINLIQLLIQKIIQLLNTVQKLSNNVQQLSNNKQSVINLLKTIGYPIPIHDFNRYNEQVSSITIFEDEPFNTIIISLQNSFFQYMNIFRSTRIKFKLY